MLHFLGADNHMLAELEVHNRINIHTGYRITSYRIQYSLVPITVYGPIKQDNFKKYRLILGDAPLPLNHFIHQ